MTKKLRILILKLALIRHGNLAAMKVRGDDTLKGAHSLWPFLGQISPILRYFFDTLGKCTILAVEQL